LKTFRTRRPLVVKAKQCLHDTILFTNVGQRKVLPGDWIVEDENHECHIVDNAFFQSAFTPASSGPEKARNQG
jgi:hypothetical protein